MRFLHPELFLLLLLVLPGLWALELAWRRWRRHRAADFAEAHLVSAALPVLSAGHGGLRIAAYSLGVAALITALARPQGPAAPGPGFKPGLDLMLVADGSLSMLARDVKPDRLGAVRREADALAERLPGVRVGAVAFAGGAWTLCPLTLDADALRLGLAHLDPWTLPVRGSDPAAGLTLALEKLPAHPGAARAVVLFTDGEVNRPGRLDELARAARAQGVRVDVVGIGTLAGGPIPLGRDLWGRETYRVFRERVVVTRLRSLDLRRAAQFGGGRYWSVGEGAEAAAPGLARELSRLEHGVVPTEGQSVRPEYYPLFALLALLLLALEPLWPVFRRRA
jgi:Ca-activated chloride channel homolog